MLATPRLRRAALGALAFSLVACSKDKGLIVDPGGGGPGQSATQLVFVVQPADIVAGASFTALRLEIRDAAGNIVTSATGPVSLAITTNPSAATLNGTATVNAVAGVATFSGLSITKAASGYQLTASSGALTSSPSSPFSVTPAAAARLVFAVQPPNELEANLAMSPRVRVDVQDTHGNLTAAGPVTLALAQSPWPRTTLSGAVTSTATTGSASFADLGVDRPGSGYVLRATSGSLSATSNAFAVRASFSRIATGGWNANYDGFSCGVAAGGTFCWGADSYGQLGSPNADATESVPVLVRTSAVFTDVVAGGKHACGRTSAGAVYCWGRGTEGQLGNGSNLTSRTPVLVSGTGPGGLVVEAVSAGDQHTCALVTGRVVYCWGENRFGELGDATTSLRNVPAKVNGSGSGALQFVSVSAGSYFTCGATTALAVWCWGEGSSGRLGSSAQQSTVPVQVTGTGSGSLRFDGVSAGLAHACAVTVAPDAGKVYCWGLNLFGALGNGTTQGESNIPVLASTTQSFAAVEAGTNFTCALSTSNSVYCWGRNLSGELGNGTTTNANVPRLTATPAGIRFNAISADGVHACAIANVGAATGDVYCWGVNDDGRVGDGTTTGRPSPVRVIQ
jgi:alpha-tubulin suppressor-like RCC1 family protein